MKFLGLITRCKDEFFIQEFCDYYLSQGIDEIFVIDDDSKDKSIYKNINDNRVNIIYEKGLFKNGLHHQMDILNNYYKKIKNNFIWLISADVDEFITTKKNITNTIRDELKTTFKDVDCVKIPWVMMSSNNMKKNPKSILLENIYRWNHDLKHPHKIRKFRCRYNEIEYKCIIKTEKFNKINVHAPVDQTDKCVIVDGVKNKTVQLYTFYKNLRENDIKEGLLLCYHYRIISEENNYNKIKKAQYLKYTIDDLNESDYSEVLDETLKNKVLSVNI